MGRQRSHIYAIVFFLCYFVYFITKYEADSVVWEVAYEDQKLEAYVFSPHPGAREGILLAFYLACLQEEMDWASKRSVYAGVIRHLKGLRNYPKGEARRLAGEWRQAYPRRRAMLDELKTAWY